MPHLAAVGQSTKRKCFRVECLIVDHQCKKATEAGLYVQMEQIIAFQSTTRLWPFTGAVQHHLCDSTELGFCVK